LSQNKEIALINRGGSMRGVIEDGQIVILGPVAEQDLRVGDAVMVRIRKERFIVHMIQDIADHHYLIGNNIGGTDGWVTSDAIYAKMIRVVNELPEGNDMELVDEKD